MSNAIDQQMLSGVHILDFTALLPGPFATVILADLGADVIKVEPPSGDFARQMPVEMFHTANRNKRSIILDLKQSDSQEVVNRLVEWADIVIEGFRPGVADRLGIGASQLRARKSSLIYCSISGYGQTGPWRDVPGHDFNYMSAAGALSFLGHWADQRPHRSGLPVADLAGSTYAAIAMLAALRRRDQTGTGSTLDISLTEAAMSFMSVRRGLDNDEPGRWHLYPTNDLFDTADGRRLSFGIVEEHFWAAFIDAVGDLEPTLRDECFLDEESRRKHGDKLHTLMARLIATRPAKKWLELFRSTNVPVQLVLTPREAADSEQSRQRGLVQKIDAERHIPFPAMTEQGPAGRLNKLAPEPGMDTHDILAQLGFSATQRASLCDSGVCMTSTYASS